MITLKIAGFPRARMVKEARQAQEPPQLAGVGVVLLIAAGALLLQTRGEGGGLGSTRSDPGPVHAHGLGVNPADGTIFIATHTGLFRVAKGERTTEPVANRYQDTMGFTVVGPRTASSSLARTRAHARELRDLTRV